MNAGFILKMVYVCGGGGGAGREGDYYLSASA